MARGKLTEEQLNQLPPEVRRETLKKRNTRAKNAAKAEAARVRVDPAPPMPRGTSVATAPPASGVAVDEDIPGIDPADTRAVLMYLDIRRRMQAIGRWAGEATHSQLMVLVRTTMVIERSHIDDVRQSVFAANRAAALAIKLHELPPDKIRKATSRPDRDVW